MPINVDNKGGPKPPSRDAREDFLDDLVRDPEFLADETNVDPADEFVDDEPDASVTPKDRGSFLAGTRRGYSDSVIIVAHKNLLPKGAAARLKEAAGYMLEIWDHLLEKTCKREPYAYIAQKLKGINRIEVNFQEASGLLGLRVMQAGRTESGVLQITLAMDKELAEEIFRTLSPGVLAFLIVREFARPGDRPDLFIQYVMDPASYKGDGYGLLHRMVEEADRFFADKYPKVFKLKSALRAGKPPAGIKQALTTLGMPEEDAARIYGAMAAASISFDIVPDNKVDPGKIAISTIEHRTSDVTLMTFRANPETIASLSTKDVQLLLARGFILGKFYNRHLLDDRPIEVSELSAPMAFFRLSYERTGGAGALGLEERTESAGLFSRRWLKGVEGLFTLLRSIGNAIQGEQLTRALHDNITATSLEARYSISNQLARMNLPPEALAKALKFISTTAVYRSLSNLAGVDDFIMTMDGKLPEGGVSVQTANYGMHHILQFAVPKTGYDKIGAMEMIKALGRFLFGLHKGTERVAWMRQVAVKTNDLPKFVAFFRLWFGYSGRAAKLTEASRLDIDGSANKEVLSAAAQSLNRIFASSRKEYFSAEGAAVQAWLKGQKVIAVEHVQPVAQERMAKWQADMQEMGGPSEAWVIPAEHGLMIMIDGRAPTPAQWDHLFVAAYLGRGKAFSIRFDNRGGVSTISAGEEFFVRMKDYMERLSGRKASTTLGAEQNEAWVSCTDAKLKAEYVEALRWMRENRGKIPDYLQPKPTDDTETLKGKYRTFSKLYHPDYAKTPAEAELYKDGVPYWDTLKSLAKVGDKRGDADGEVVIGGAAETRAAITVDATGENGQGRARRVKPEQIIARMMERDGPLSEEDIVELARSLGSDAERLKVQMKEKDGDLWDFLKVYVKEDARDRLADRFKAPRDGRAEGTSRPREKFKGK